MRCSCSTRTACGAAAGAAGLTRRTGLWRLDGPRWARRGDLNDRGRRRHGRHGRHGRHEPGEHRAHGLLGLLIRVGPGLLIASAVLIALAFALRRPGATVPALLAGAVLYAGMYAQPSRTVMYASIAAGYAGWAVLYLWVRNVALVREYGHRSHQGDKEVHGGHHPGA